jgi:hypothetical protein
MRIRFVLAFAAVALVGCPQTTNPTRDASPDLTPPPPDLTVAADLSIGGQSCGGRGQAACPSGTFCELVEGTCGAADQGGTCAAIPAVCDQIYDPVCGCDNHTYGNDCERRAAGVSLQSTGACPCTVDTDCPQGQKCCYPCGIPGCKYACTSNLMNGMCPNYP